MSKIKCLEVTIIRDATTQICRVIPAYELDCLVAVHGNNITNEPSKHIHEAVADNEYVRLENAYGSTTDAAGNAVPVISQAYGSRKGFDAVFKAAVVHAKKPPADKEPA